MEQRINNIMLAGTGSDVGKSVLSTALCRIFVEDGFRPAPFKAQNMALNSYVTTDGKEIGRAQAVQAGACCLEATSEMNPVLLKPSSDHTTQVIVNGVAIGNKSAYEYFKKEGKEYLRNAAHAAFDKLAESYNPIVLEGAGSICELNLKNSDIVNLSMARYANAKVILVADIDRGGVFASCYGSIMLQTPEDKELIKGIIINKFRGDIKLFEEGKKIIENICKVPVLGIIPAFEDINIEEEDSVALSRKNARTSANKINIAVVLLKHISNFTDFDPLERDKRVNLFYTNSAKDIESADIIIIPGSKSTISDLLELRRNGIANSIVSAFKSGKKTIGICGGYQMLGKSIKDPLHAESEIEEIPGLGILDMETCMEKGKTTKQIEFMYNGEVCRGYEIHQGKSTLTDLITEEKNCIGTYIHGIFDNNVFINHILNSICNDRTETAEEFKEKQYKNLANHVRKNIDMTKLYEILKSNDR